jgi:DNA modification methylase
LTFSGPAASFDYYRVKEGTREETTTTGTSIFDPVLCELAYRWFSPPGGVILDPFAGGSVRGVVASCLGRSYTGVDLSDPQIAANKVQGEVLCVGYPAPAWYAGDSAAIRTICPDIRADFLFSCPPYGCLEQYSDDPRDLSTYTAAKFNAVYTHIIKEALSLLKNDRFACFVVGDYRDKEGFYCNLPGVTIAAFEAAGARLYNEAILVTAVGSLPIRVSRQFSLGKKLGKTHQNILVFVKGDPKRAAEACKED